MNSVGNTPLVQLKNFGGNAKIFAKLERYNPSGSVKDRAVYHMVNTAEQRGVIKSGTAIIEPTSGNTGIALAALGAARGYRVIIVMPANMSEERRKIISFYGAELVLTDPAFGMGGAVERAKRLQKEIPQSVILGQFENPANPAVHFKITAPEIWRQTEGKTDIFVAGVGTGGTLSGCGEYLKRVNPRVKIYAVLPEKFPHKIQGIGAGFLPKTFNRGICAGQITVSDENAFKFQRELARAEGIFAGISSGAALCACAQLAAREENFGKNIVTVFPDSGDKYLSVLSF